MPSDCYTAAACRWSAGPPPSRGTHQSVVHWAQQAMPRMALHHTIIRSSTASRLEQQRSHPHHSTTRAIKTDALLSNQASMPRDGAAATRARSECCDSPSALDAAILGDHMPRWYPAAAWPALALCQPPHSLLDLLGAATLDRHYAAVGAWLLRLVEGFLTGPLLLPSLLLAVLLRLLLRLLLPPEAALQVCCIVGRQCCRHREDRFQNQYA